MESFRTRSHVATMRIIGIMFLCIESFISASASNAQGNAYLNTHEIGGSAVDVKGVRHRGSDYPKNHPPWMDDRVKAIAPDYPYAERLYHHEGVGLFQLTLNVKTGSVGKTTVIKSTGFRALDECAMAAFRQWRWKPGKWKEIDMHVTFTMRKGPLPLAPGAVRLPPPPS